MPDRNMVNLLLRVPAWILRKRKKGKRIHKWLLATPGAVTAVCLIYEQMEKE